MHTTPATEPAAWPGSWPEVFSRVGNTPMVGVTLPGPADAAIELRVKLEGCNPSGSVKDRAAVSLIRGRVEAGLLRPGVTMLDASSGNMASALAMFGRALGVPVEVVCNSSLTTDKRRFIEFFGGRVVDNDFGPFTFDGFRKCQAMMAAEPGKYCFLDQLHNWDNPKAHAATADEILRDLPSVRMIVGSLGSGGTMSGLCRAVRAVRPDVRLVAVSSASGSRFPGVGAFDDGDYVTPFLADARENKVFDAMVRVGRQEALQALEAISRQGLFCGPQTGAVVAGALREAEETGIDSGIVVVSGDAGWKNWDFLGELGATARGTAGVAGR